MVLVWLFALRDLRTKKAEPPQPFPPPQPRVHKTKPKSVRTIHERSSKSSQCILLLLPNIVRLQRGYSGSTGEQA